jgi:hypothetical protein
LLQVTFVNALLGHQLFRFEMMTSCTVREIKVKLSDEHVPFAPELFKLEFRGKVLDDDQRRNDIDNYNENTSILVIVETASAQAPTGASSSHETAGSHRSSDQRRGVSSDQESPEHATPLIRLVLELFQVLPLPRPLPRLVLQCFAAQLLTQLPVYFLPPLQRVVYPPHTSPVDA